MSKFPKYYKDLEENISNFSKNNADDFKIKDNNTMKNFKKFDKHKVVFGQHNNFSLYEYYVKEIISQLFQYPRLSFWIYRLQIDKSDENAKIQNSVYIMKDKAKKKKEIISDKNEITKESEEEKEENFSLPLYLENNSEKTRELDNQNNSDNVTEIRDRLDKSYKEIKSSLYDNIDNPFDKSPNAIKCSKKEDKKKRKEIKIN